MLVRHMLLHRMALVSVRLFCKNLGNLQEFFWQMVYSSPWQKIARTPMFLYHVFVGRESLDVRYCFLSKAWGDRRRLTSYHLDLSVCCFFSWNTLKHYPSRRFCEIYWEYRTAGHLVFWKPWPAVELKKVLSVTKHGFVFWAQRKPNARLEIYKAFQDRLTFLNRHMIV